MSVTSTPWSTRSVYQFMRIRIGSPRSAEEPIGRTVLAPTVALRVFLVRLVRRVVCGDAVRGGRPVQFDGDALDLAVVVKRFDALLPPVHAVLPRRPGCRRGRRRRRSRALVGFLGLRRPSRAAASSEGSASVPAGHRMDFQLASPLVDDRCGSFAGSGVNDAGVARPLSGPPSASTSLKPSNRHCANRPSSVIDARS